MGVGVEEAVARLSVSGHSNIDGLDMAGEISGKPRCL
jgi:hypothetical protein